MRCPGSTTEIPDLLVDLRGAAGVTVAQGKGGGVDVPTRGEQFSDRAGICRGGVLFGVAR